MSPGGLTAPPHSRRGLSHPSICSLCPWGCGRPGPDSAQLCVSRQENQQSFAVARTYTLVREAWPGDTASNMELTRGPGWGTSIEPMGLDFLPDSSSPRYQYFSKGRWVLGRSGRQYPTSTDYYNYDPFQKPAEGEAEAAARADQLQRPHPRGDEGSEDYQNSVSIQQWRESKRVVEPAPQEAPLSLAGSPDEDGEPDYVNGDVAATEA
uniref:Linker for activation of T cells family member 2 n=1 Tax=Moschus moschiferus TaxID=68415 RepID=A0A8C6CVG2_MOSMO